MKMPGGLTTTALPPLMRAARMSPSPGVHIRRQTTRYSSVAIL